MDKYDKVTGGPARPIVINDPHFYHAESGMTLLDHFAASALSGMCADKGTHQYSHKRVAEQAYDYARAMILKKREVEALLDESK